MASKKNYWYVIVMTNHGAVFVTETNNWERTAKFEKDKKPMEMTKENAQYLAMGLTINGNPAFAVCNSWEVDYQPYNYEFGEFEWKQKEKENGEKVS